MTTNIVKKTYSADMRPTLVGQEVLESIRVAIIEARVSVVVAVNTTMVSVYHEIGRQLHEEVGERAEYGKQLLPYLSEQLTAEFGKGFTVVGLRNMRRFYQVFPIRSALRSELGWTQYRLLMRVEDPRRRDFYMNECIDSGWTSRQLERQINSFYFERILATQTADRKEVSSEIFKLEPARDPGYHIKDPYVLEFLEIKENTKYSEGELEKALIDKLQEFLLELGKGFSFVARQKRITTEHGGHYYIDLVFYNYILKCFVVIDLKTNELTYQDVGQIDFYVQLFDETIKGTDDNPTIGLLLVADKDESIVKYSVLSEKENLFASKYQMFLPTEEELMAELSRERELIERQIKDSLESADE